MDREVQHLLAAPAEQAAGRGVRFDEAALVVRDEQAPHRGVEESLKRELPGLGFGFGLGLRLLLREHARREAGQRFERVAGLGVVRSSDARDERADPSVGEVDGRGEEMAYAARRMGHANVLGRDGRSGVDGLGRAVADDARDEARRGQGDAVERLGPFRRAASMGDEIERAPLVRQVKQENIGFERVERRRVQALEGLRHGFACPVTRGRALHGIRPGASAHAHPCWPGCSPPLAHVSAAGLLNEP
nr:hypothetical protein [Polyangium fumosum]